MLSNIQNKNLHEIQMHWQWASLLGQKNAGTVVIDWKYATRSSHAFIRATFFTFGDQDDDDVLHCYTTE